MGKVIAIIPARVGSKRILKKNIRDLMGKPLIAWTIEAAVHSKIFDDILVSTDSEEIAAIARQWGAAVPFLRDPKDADDVTSVHIATTNALVQMEKHKNIQYEHVVQLMPNCPCRTDKDIVRAYQHFLSTKPEFQISVFPFGWMNPWWAMQIDSKNLTPTPLFPDALKKRSQDLGPLYCPTGSVWIARAESLKRERTFYGPGYRVFPLDWESAVDIDEESDFRMAQAVFLLRRGQF